MRNRIRNWILNPVGIYFMVQEERKLQADQTKHDAMIAESQAKIGPYRPAVLPVQVWA